MADAPRPWAIDPVLARDLSAAIGWRPDDGAAALAALLPSFAPMGSTAKLAAIAAGGVPPGADPGPLARQFLDVGAARAAAPAGGAASPSWSCWVASTVMAALVDAAELGPVQVVATRRSDDGAPMVDFHAAVTVADGDAEWICDPYFGAGIRLAHDSGAAVVDTGPLGTASAERSVDGGWVLDLGWEVWDIVLRFRRFGPALDAGDVQAMAAISATHSGVPLRPYARLHLGDAIVDASESAAGAGVLHAWTRADGRSEQVVASWPDAVEVLADRTGVRII